MADGAHPQAGPGGQPEVPGTQQSPGQRDNPALSAKLAQKAQEKAEVRAESLSIRERLTRRAKTETIQIPFQDDLGEFIVEVRIPTAAEMDGLMVIQKEVSAATAAGDTAFLAEANGKLAERLAALAVDETLDAEFFRSGGYLASDLSQIIKEIFLEEERRIKKIASFRQDAGRPGDIRTM